MKPRINKEFSILLKQPAWFCRGAGSLGFGSTPAEAYWVWKWWINERGIK
jgi:hypothetical protein